MNSAKNFLFLSLTTVALAACGDGQHEKPEHGSHHAHQPLPAPPSGELSRADFINNSGEKLGEVIVAMGPKGALLRVDLSGLTHGFHGIHLHMVGNCSDHDAGFKASGSHLNPNNNDHGLMNEEGYEMADLPNVYAHHSGHARAELFIGGLTEALALDADGFAIVVHENEDDHMTQPIGGAGARVACAAFGG